MNRNELVAAVMSEAGATMNVTGMFAHARRAFALGMVLVGMTLPLEASAAEVVFPVDHDNPKASVPPEEQRTAHPAAHAAWVQEVRQQAEAAEAARDWPKAVRYYQALSFGEPDSAWAYGKLCDIHEGPLAELQQAEHYCWAGVKRADATLSDRYHFLDIAFALQVSEEKGGVKVRRAQMVQAVIEDLKPLSDKDPKAMPSERTPGSAAGYLPIVQQREVYACQLAAMVQEGLDKCLKDATAAGLAKPRLLPFQWADARSKGDAVAVGRIERSAAQAGIAVEDLPRLAVGGRAQVAKAAPVSTASSAVIPRPAPTVAAAQIPVPKAEEAAPSAKAGGALPLEEGIAVGAAAVGAAALAWLIVDRSRKAKATQPLADGK